MAPYTIITGASGGIGLALAREAAADGRQLILIARDESKLRKIAKDLPVKTKIFTVDLADAAKVTTCIREIKRQGLEVDTLVNNAGMGDYGLFEKSDPQTQQAMIALNISSLVQLTQAFLPNIISQRGSILNVGSVASFIPGPYMSVYFATKAFVLSFSEALHEEIRGTGVTVTCLCPGPTATQFGASAHVGEDHSISRARDTAEEVARYGWKAMKRGKPIAIYSLKYKVAVQLLTRIFPRFFVRRLMKKLQSS